MSDPFSLAGRVALVTGASGGLGRHFARVLHAAGAAVALAARRLDSVAEDVAALGERAMAVALDVTEPDSVTAALDAVEARLGPCDLLVNNAGIAVTKRFLDQELADWDAVMGVDLRGAFLVGQAVARRMAAAGKGGAIVNIASILGDRVIPGVAGYTAAKGGLLQLTRQMAIELARYGIRVNALAPGYVVTDINRDALTGEFGQQMVKRVPQRRFGTPDDLTGPLLLLVSDAGRHMTGSVVTVDGGHGIGGL